MKIKLSELKSLIREVLTEEDGYENFFRATMNKFGISSPKELSGDKEKEFYDYIDKNWSAKKETDIDETLEPVSPASGNPLKSVKAKKAERILAKEAKVEEYVRKIIREELKFVMFNEVPGTISRKRAKKRIAQSGDANKTL